MKLLRVALSAAVAVLPSAAVVGLAAPAHAAGGLTVSVVGSQLVLLDDYDVNNVVTIAPSGSSIAVRDIAVNPTPGPGCAAGGFPSIVVCSVGGGFTSISATLAGGADNVAVTGLAVPGKYDGGAGTDGFTTGTGSDIVSGGSGVDTVGYGTAVAGVTAQPGGAATDGAPGENDDIKADVENVAGSPFADVLLGDGGPNTLQGGDGNDLIDGGLGADDMEGQAGQDTVTYAVRVNPVIARIGGSIGQAGEVGEGDSVDSTVERLIGGSGADQLGGSNAQNWLEGGPGDDTLEGNEAPDKLDGGPGADTLLGGSNVGGIDCAMYDTRVAPVTVRAGSGAVSGELGENDTVGADVECAEGGSGSDLLVGTDAVNVLIGNAGDDRLLGGGARDTFDGGVGNDTVSYEDHALPVTVTLDGVYNDGAAGETDNVASSVENVTGGAAADRLTGNGSVNVLRGGAGDDVIDGGLGADVVEGGAGSDTITYAVRTAPVTVTLDGVADEGEAGEGDQVAADVENVTGGEAADRLTGSGSANVLLGGGGDDVLDGGLGADVLGGGAGVDVATYAVRTTRLAIRLDDLANDGAKGEGDDVRTDVENVIGGRLRDKIIGSAAANVLTGGRGADVLKGKAGKDRALGGAGKDRCVAEVERSCAS